MDVGTVLINLNIKKVQKSWKLRNKFVSLCQIEVMILHDKKTVLEKLAHLPKLKYNKFQWWRSHGIPQELHHYQPLINRINNGDFDPSPYLWMAQLALHDMQERMDAEKSIDKKRDVQGLYMEKYRRLQIDYEKDEAYRLVELKKAFFTTFRISKEVLEEIMQDFVGSLQDLYYFLEQQNKPLCQK